MKLRVNVKCDKCDWRLEEQNIYDWHNKECPKCNDCIIINDKDLNAYKNIVKINDALESTGIVKILDKTPDNYNGILVNIKFDSAKLR